jgi:transcriptional regulator with XRE-family HTH domain
LGINFVENYVVYAIIGYEVRRMKHYSPSERLLIEEITEAARKTKVAARGLTIGKLIRSIRLQLGMSQKTLAKRAGVPQSTISRLEQGERDANLSTLSKILGAMSCELVTVPLLQESVEVIRRKQARKMAEKQIRYLKGTMNLEDQQPDSRFVEILIKQEEERLLHEPNSRLWSDREFRRSAIVVQDQSV